MADYIDPFDTAPKTAKTKGYVDPFDVAEPISTDQSRYTGLPQDAGWAALEDTNYVTGKPSAKYSATDTVTGKQVEGTKFLNQFVPPETPLSAAPKPQAAIVGNMTATQFASTPEYLAQPPQVQQQMMMNFMQNQSAMNPKKKMFGGEGDRRSVVGIGGDQSQRQMQSEKPIEYLKGEMPHRSPLDILEGDPRYFTENLPRSVIRGAAKAVELTPLIAGGAILAPAAGGSAALSKLYHAAPFLGLAGVQATDAALDAKGGPSIGAFTGNLGEQAGGLGRMLTDPGNIFQKSPKASLEESGNAENLWQAVFKKDANFAKYLQNTRQSYLLDSPGEAAIDAYFMYQGLKGIGKGGYDWYDAKKTQPSQEAFTRTVSDQVSKMFTGGAKGKGTPAQRKAYDRKAGEAFEFILQNKDLFNVLDNEGQRIELPRNRVELAEFVDQAKNTAFTEYDFLRKLAEGEGVGVKLNPVITELKRIIEDPNNATVEAQPIVEAAKKRLAAYEVHPEGQYTLSQAQEAIKIANEKLKGMYGRGASYLDTVDAVVDKGIADILRRELDQTIEGATDSSYQSVKNKYAALKAIEEDVNRAANRQRNTPDFKFDFGDIYTVSKAALAIAKADPALAAGAGAGALMKATMKRGKPDPTIERTFKRLEKLLPKDEGLTGPVDTGHVATFPREQFIPPEMRGKSSPINNPVDPNLQTPMKTPFGLEGTTTPNTPLEFDPNLRNIAPPNEFSPTMPKIDGQSVQSNAGQVQGTPDALLNRQSPYAPGSGNNAPGEMMPGERPTHPQDNSPVDLNATRAELRKSGFDEADIAEMTSTDPVEKAVKGEGTGAAAVAKTAAKYGIPAAIVAGYLAADPEKRKQMAMIPMFGAMIAAVNKGDMAKRTEILKQASKALFDNGLAMTEPIKNKNGIKLELMDVTTGQPLRVSLKDGGTRVVVDPNGQLTAGIHTAYLPGTNTFTVTGAYLPEGLQGNKIGSALYQKMADYATSQGKHFASDSMGGTSALAAKSWNGLAERGYPVEKSKNAEVSANGHVAPKDFLNDHAFIIKHPEQATFTEPSGKTSFPIYEWAAATGLSAAIIKQFIGESDDNKKKMIKRFPKLAQVN